MYIFIKEKTDDSKEKVCVVQARDAEEGKKMAGIPTSCNRWIFLPDGLLAGLTDIKSGYVEKEL